jgi:hypothetical protein
MATRIEDLQKWVSERFKRVYNKLDPKYRVYIQNFLRREYTPMEDGTSKIVSFGVHSETGEIIDVNIRIKGVRKHELGPEDVNAIARLIRDLGYEDSPIHVHPLESSIAAKKNDMKFYFYFSGKEGIANLNFPMELKEEIPKITEAFYKFLRKPMRNDERFWKKRRSIKYLNSLGKLG